jgi:hypothetical protein
MMLIFALIRNQVLFRNGLAVLIQPKHTISAERLWDVRAVFEGSALEEFCQLRDIWIAPWVLAVNNWGQPVAAAYKPTGTAAHV